MGVSVKEKGNREERKQAKLLSVWMFDDPDMLKRQSDSGALELIWSGDVAPLKQMPLEWKTRFPFLIEVKCGYKDSLPSFWNYTKLEAWCKKALKEGKTHNQHVMLVITQFHRRAPLVTTNYFIKTHKLQVCFPIEFDDKQQYMYVYKLKDILKDNFKEVFDFEEIINHEQNIDRS